MPVNVRFILTFVLVMKSAASTFAPFTGVTVALLLCVSIPSLRPAFADNVSDYSFSGLRRHVDSSGGEYRYYPVTSVPGKKHQKFFFGTYVRSLPPDSGQNSLILSEDVGYLIDCRNTEITRVFSAIHLTPKMLPDLPPEIADKVRKSNLMRLVKVQGLETKNYRRHNVLRQAVTYMDTSAFELSCGYTPMFD